MSGEDSAILAVAGFARFIFVGRRESRRSTPLQKREEIAALQDPVDIPRCLAVFVSGVPCRSMYEENLCEIEVALTDGAMQWGITHVASGINVSAALEQGDHLVLGAAYDGDVQWPITRVASPIYIIERKLEELTEMLVLVPSEDIGRCRDRRAS